MAGSASFGKRPPSGPASYRQLPKLPETSGVGGFARLPAFADQPVAANDSSATDWREAPLPAIPPAHDMMDRFVDEIDIETWKAQRKSQRRIPWRQISLMAALSFGVGSFVLPGDVNAMVRPILWALSGIAFASGFVPAKKKS